MKKLMEFFKTTAMGGLFVLLPILLLYLLLGEALGMIVALATPLPTFFRREPSARLSFPSSLD